MKRGLIRKKWTNKAEFLKSRLDTIGSSEVGTVLGLNPYKISASLYLEKVGIQPPWSEGNAATHWGTVLEDTIAETWQYYEPDVPDSYVQNFNQGFKQRSCRKSNATLIDPALPFLSCNPDRIIQKGSFRIDTGELLKKEGILEIKTASNMAMAKWEAAIPPQYVAQVQEQLLVTGLEYAEIAIFDNHRNFSVFPLEADKNFQDIIVERCGAFWGLVMQGRAIFELMAMESSAAKKEEMRNEIYALAPDDSDVNPDLWREFLSEKFVANDEAPVTLAGQDIYETVQKINKYNEVSKMAKTYAEHEKNKVREFMGESTKLEFSDYNGKVTNKSTKTGNRSLRIYVDNDFDNNDLKIEI